MQGYLEEVSHLPLFAGLSVEEAVEFLTRGQRLEVPAGEALIRTGEPADSFYLIVRGILEVRCNQGNEPMPIAQLQSGHLVGEMAYFQAAPFRLADAFVLRDAVLCKFPYGDVRELDARHPELAAKVRHNLRHVTVERARQNLARTGKRRAAVFSKPEQLLTPVQRRQAIGRCAAFADFSAIELGEIVGIAEPVRVGAGAIVVAAGDPADAMYVCALGHLEVTLATREGVFGVARIGPGQCIGELPLVYRLPTRTATVVAQEASTLLRIAYADLEQVLTTLDGARERMQANLGTLAYSRAAHLRDVEEAAVQSRSQGD